MKKHPRPQVGYFIASHTSTLDDSSQPFALWVPTSYTPRKKYPIIVALHGTDADERMIPEQCFQIHEHGFREDVLLLCPLGRGDLWFEYAGETDLWEALHWVRSRYQIDARRQYLTGLSMGGFATWKLAARYPEQWAAIAPICGGSDPATVGPLKNIPTWCIHGEQDPHVPVEESRRMIGELQRRRFRHRYDELPGWGHESWEFVYHPGRTTDSLVDWFLQYRKRSSAPKRLTPKRTGSFLDLFSERLMISYPAGNTTAARILQHEAGIFSRFSSGDQIMRSGRFIVKADTELTPADLSAANHLILTHDDEHRGLRRVKSQLKARHRRGQLEVNGQRYLGQSLVAATLQPSPWNSKRLLGLLTGQQPSNLAGIAARLLQPGTPLQSINLYDSLHQAFLSQS